MSLVSVRSFGFRNLTAQSLSFSKLNYIHGPNGSGKSSLFEALFLLGALRSFRAPRGSDALIAKGVGVFYLDFETQGGRFSLQKAKDSPLVLQYGEEKIPASRWLNLAPAVQIASPQSGNLLGEDPKARRQFFDWLFSHVSPAFFDHKQLYDQALESRNLLLKRRQHSDDAFWRDRLSRYGDWLALERLRVFELWRAQWQALLSEVVEPELEFVHSLELQFIKGHPEGPLLPVLEEMFEEDARAGYTRVGPHRFDVNATLEGDLAASVLSRGQIKRVHLLWILSALRLIHPIKPSLLLVDDLESELDAFGVSWLLERTASLGTQVFVSSLLPLRESLVSKGRQWRVFEIEEGVIRLEGEG